MTKPFDINSLEIGDIVLFANDETGTIYQTSDIDREGRSLFMVINSSGNKRHWYYRKHNPLVSYGQLVWSRGDRVRGLFKWDVVAIIKEGDKCGDICNSKITWLVNPEIIAKKKYVLEED